MHISEKSCIFARNFCVPGAKKIKNTMGKLIDFIAKETEGEPFGSFKYGYDNDPQYRKR